MKKLLSILGLVAVVGVGSFAFASDGIVEGNDYEDNTNYEQRVENGRNYDREENDTYRRGHCWRYGEEDLSEEEIEEWENHHRNMYGDGYNNPNGRRGMHRNGRRGR